MDRMLYVAMSGAKETMISQAGNANNLANANTPGFLADLTQFRSMPVFGQGFHAEHGTRPGHGDSRPGLHRRAGSGRQRGL